MTLKNQEGYSSNKSLPNKNSATYNQLSETFPNLQNYQHEALLNIPQNMSQENFL